MSYRYHRYYQKESLGVRKLDSNLIKRLYTFLKPHRRWLLISILLLIVGKGIEAFIPIFVGKVAQAIMVFQKSDPTSNDTFFFWIVQCALIMCALLLASYVMEVSNVLLKSRVGQQAINLLRQHVYSHILHMPIAYFDHHPIGRLMTRTIHDIDQIDQMFTDSIVPLIGNLFLFLCMGVGIFILDWRVGVVMAMVMPFLGWLLHQFRFQQRRSYELIRAIVSSLNSFVQEHLLGVNTISSFGLSQKEREDFEEINEDHSHAYLESVKHFSFFIAGIDFLSNFSLIVIFVTLMSFAPLPSSFQVGYYVTFSLYVMMLFRPMIDLAERYNILQSALAASERVFEVLDQTSESSEFLDRNEFQAPSLNSIESIVFDNVWFAYDRDHWILKGLSFEIKYGETLGIVGLTGAGKTSIISLLLRFYEFQKGLIKINGYDIRQYSLHNIRKQFGTVFQDPILFSGTIEDNIGLYDPLITPEKIEMAIDYVNLRLLLEHYSQGKNYFLLERGKSLSAGERQLISMARAVAHERPVFLFDEATANIDTGTEKIVQEALKKLLNHKTAIIIAHRLSTLKDVAKIIVLDQGKVVEAGSHEELIQRKGYYEKMYRLQFQFAE
jgi:ATP-binding cassette, subfamily B, multidrug efflux pump